MSDIFNELGGRGRSDSRPVAPEPPRIFIYTSQRYTDLFEEMSERAPYRNIDYRTARTFANSWELIAAYGWCIFRHAHRDPVNEFPCWVYWITHDEDATPCPVVAVEWRDDASFYVATRVRLPREYSFHLEAILSTGGDIAWSTQHGLPWQDGESV